MKRATCHEEDRQLTFDCYCKRVLKNEAIDIQRHKKYLNETQVSLSQLTPEQLGELAVYDEYPTDYTHYKVLEHDIEIRDELLAEALNQLSEKKRNIILLASLDYSDPEIAELLNLVRRTVNYQKHRALEELKKRMEGTQNEEK